MLVALRLAPDEIERLDRYAATVSKKADGLRVERSKAARLLILQALEHNERKRRTS